MSGDLRRRLDRLEAAQPAPILDRVELATIEDLRTLSDEHLDTLDRADKRRSPGTPRLVTLAQADVDALRNTDPTEASALEAALATLRAALRAARDARFAGNPLPPHPDAPRGRPDGGTTQPVHALPNDGRSAAI